MARNAILPLKVIATEIDIYSNKSALFLFWLLAQQGRMKKEGFSVNESAREIDISVGLVHKVVKQLEFNGMIAAQGLRTSKKFFLKNPDEILIGWIKAYNLIRKTKTKGYAATLQPHSKFEKYGLIPALHLASSEIFHIKSTNLRLKEYYLPDWQMLPQVVSQLELQELDRGYELLLIKPYYSALLEKIKSEKESKVWKDAYALLTVLDLCHFPIRGIEQAEALFRKTELKNICSWNDVDRAIG